MKNTIRGIYPPELVADFFKDEIPGAKFHTKNEYIPQLGRHMEFHEIQFSNPNNNKCKMKAYFNSWNQCGHDFKPPQDAWKSLDEFVAYLHGFDDEMEGRQYLIEKYNLSTADLLFARKADHKKEKKEEKPVIGKMSIYSAKTVELKPYFKRLDCGDMDSTPFLNFYHDNFFPLEQIPNTYYCTKNIWSDDPTKREFFKDRLILAFKEGGRLVHYSGRHIKWDESMTKTPKWLHCSGSETHKFVGNIDTTAEEVMLFESAKNAWKLGDNGLFVQGTAVSKEQIMKIKMKNFKNIVICFDNDKNASAGKKHAFKVYQEMMDEEMPVQLFDWDSFCSDRGRYINDFGDIPIHKIKYDILQKYFISGLKAEIVYKTGSFLPTHTSEKSERR